MQQQPTIEMLERYLAGQASEEECRLVELWYEAAGGKDIPEKTIPGPVKEQLYGKIRESLGLRPKVVRLAARWRMAAAAAAVLVLVASAQWLWQDRPEASPVAEERPDRVPAQEVMPGGDRATLTLADGSVILLDSAANGSLALQGSVQVLKLDDGRLQYESEGGKDTDGTTLYNTIATPNGGQYRLTLPDGSTVWLNAASSLRFPVSFGARERTVELSGEGYFDIRRDESRPFRVLSASASDKDFAVQVLGTSFNVNMYDNEPARTVTVVSGKVVVQGPGAASELLTRGQQVQSTDTKMVRYEGVDLEPVVAWKNGLFQFDSEDLASIMRQVARWYDVEVEFPGGVPKGRITGKVRRDMNLSQVLKVLELSGVDFKMEARTIVVTGS